MHEKLQNRTDWLLVFDNVEKPEDIADYLPRAGGHVLITSRHQAWRGVAEPVEVKEWPSEVAVEFLTKRTGSPDAAAAAELAREMDCLPLALEQAAAYVDYTGGTLAGYLARFRTHQVELLRRGAPGGEGAATVATTWILSFQRLENESPTGVALLNLCAFFAPDDIPRDVIAAGADHLAEPLRTAVEDELAFDDAVAAIRRYSLIETGGGSTLSLHRLVQAIIRDRLGENGRKEWAEAAVKVVNAACRLQRDNDKTMRIDPVRLLPHAAATTDFAESLGIGLEAAARLTYLMGRHLMGRRQFPKAEAAFERTIRLTVKHFGPDVPNVADWMNKIGNAWRESDRFSEAKVAYERALRIDEKVFGPEHQNVARHVHDLGLVLKDSKDLPGAKAALERALQIDEKAFGPEHQEVARDVNNLGLALQDLGDLPGAKAAYQRALAICRNLLGDDHANTHRARKNLESLPADR